MNPLWLKGFEIVQYGGSPVLSAGQLLTISIEMPWSQSGEMSTKNTLSTCESSCTAENHRAQAGKGSGVVWSFQSLNPHHIMAFTLQNLPQKLCRSFHGLCRFIWRLYQYNHRLIYQSFLFSAPCLSFLADLLAAAAVSCITCFQAPQHTC